MTPSTQRASIVPDSLSRLEDIDAKYDEVKQKIDIFKHFIDENKNIKLKINQKTKRMVPIEEDPVQLKYKDPVLAGIVSF